MTKLILRVSDTLTLLLICTAITTGFQLTPGIRSSGSTNNVHVAKSSTTCTTRIFNVPSEEIDTSNAANLEEIISSASRSAPPANFFELQESSTSSAKLAMDRGERLIEVEFPPLPADVLGGEDVSAYDVSRANLRLALDFGKYFAVEQGLSTAILVPDEAELEICLEGMQNNQPFPNLQINALLRNDDDDTKETGQLSFFSFLFGGNSGSVTPIPGTKLYIIITTSAQELPDVGELYNLTRDDDATICFYNLKLDVLRGDLGAPAFPPKDLHDRFLSRVKPVYYLRTRQYSRSVPTPPFILNYQGCLFRRYPGAYQTLLDTGDGLNYRRVKTNKVRPALGRFKEELNEALLFEGLVQEEGKTLTFLRTGYKTTTWWEECEEREEEFGASKEWTI